MAASKIRTWVVVAGGLMVVGVAIVVAGWDRVAEVNIVDTRYGGNVAYHDATDIVEQAEESLPTDLPDSVVMEIHAGISHLDNAEFRKAIGHLERVTSSAPVPALWNALGAAYLGAGDSELARGYVQRAAAGRPDDRAAKHNLTRMRRPDPKSPS